MAWVNVEIDLDEIDTDDLIDEMRTRGYHVSRKQDVTDAELDHQIELNRIVQMHRIGDPKWESAALDFMYSMTGKIV